LDEVFEFFQTHVKSADLECVVEEMPITGFGAQACQLDLFPIGKTGTFVKDGKLASYKVQMPSKTKISKSIVFDNMELDFGPHAMQPALLRKTEVNGIILSPMLLGLGKLVQFSNAMPCDTFKTIRDHICNEVLSWQTKSLRSEKFVLNDFDAMNGIEGLKGIDVSTSAGFPWCRIAHVSNKSPWVEEFLGDDGKKLYTLNDKMAEAVDKRIKAAEENIIVETYFVDTLKDETRPIEKVLEGKTRVFQVGPFDLTIVLRKYFGHFIAHLQSSFLVGEVSVGINPDSMDWTIFAKRLQEVGSHFLAGDVSNWDACMPYQAALLFLYCSSKFYNDGAKNKRIRRVLLATILCSNHLVDNFVFCVKQSNTSGNALTTYLNCLWNMATYRYVYLRVVETDLRDFNKYVRAGVFGDDNVQCVGGLAVGKLDMFSMQKYLKEIGIIYTSATKAEIKLKYLDISEVSYLKRNFKYDPRLKIYLAPLDMTTIMEIARWSESNPLNVVDQMARFNQTLMFLSSHSRELFDKTRKIFVKYCHAILRGDLVDEDDNSIVLPFDSNQLFTFERCKQIFYLELYGQPCDLSALDPETRVAIAKAVCEL